MSWKKICGIKHKEKKKEKYAKKREQTGSIEYKCL